MTPHQFEYKKVTEVNMIPKKILSHMTQDTIGKTFK